MTRILAKAAIALAGSLLIGACSTQPNERQASDQQEGGILGKLTPQEQAIAMQALSGIPSAMIDIEVNCVLFDLSDIEAIVREKGFVVIDDLMPLWRKGEAKLVCSPKVLAHSGQEATVKSVVEYIYPTDFIVQSHGTTNASGSTTVSAIDTIVPNGFQTREVGQILCVNAELDPSGKWVRLTIAPEIVEEPTWKDYGPTYKDRNGKPVEGKMEIPFFKNQKLFNSITVPAGIPTLIGGGTGNRADGKLMYMFVTARVIDVSAKTDKK